ncbi:MAG: RimK family protein [Pirellulaceae bacterium]|nr:RimK family protein [Pirellulaceae bacterium]
MSTLIVVDDPQQWPFEIPSVEVVPARAYLTSERFASSRGMKVFNLCRSYRYQTAGYYVSLLAEARGHRPLPSVTTIQDLRSRGMARLISADLEDLIQKTLSPLQSEKFALSIYFGRNMAKRYDRLSLQLFNLIPAPLLRAHFVRDGQTWRLRSVAAIAANEIPQGHRAFLVDVAKSYFEGRRASVRRTNARFDLAILHNPQEVHPPSNEKALAKFIKAGQKVGFETELILASDFGRLAEFDALFIRETTNVNHHTYRFAQRAAREGLVVIDDPQSIVRCSNKVYLAELLSRHKVPMPKTCVVHRGNIEIVAAEIGFPCVLKKPDSAFSLGVVKVEGPEELAEQLDRFLADSDLVVAQAFVPTTFDWRIGVLDSVPLYACRYYMARKHWQIVDRDGQGGTRYGKVETLPVESAPRKAVRVALQATEPIGDGLYGVDVKQSGNEFYVIEVNDNPNIDAGYEDVVLRDELYDRIMRVFMARVERRKAGVYRK